MATVSSGLDDDNVIVAIPQTGNRPIQHGSEVKELVVKFLFRPKGGNNNTEVACTHYAILCSISDIYPEVQIFDNFGKAMQEFPSINSYNAYLSHFKLQFVKANENKNRKAIYLVFHRLRSSVSLGEIRRHATIAALLQKVNTRLSVHHWTEDETRIANLVFYNVGNKMLKTCWIYCSAPTSNVQFYFSLHSAQQSGCLLSQYSAAKFFSG